MFFGKYRKVQSKRFSVDADTTLGEWRFASIEAQVRRGPGSAGTRRNMSPIGSATISLRDDQPLMAARIFGGPETAAFRFSLVSKLSRTPRVTFSSISAARRMSTG
jgi:hypothetical protein